MGKEDIDFSSIHLKSSSENAYALYCAAKDLYNGSRHLAIDDIADTGLIKGTAMYFTGFRADLRGVV